MVITQLMSTWPGYHTNDRYNCWWVCDGCRKEGVAQKVSSLSCPHSPCCSSVPVLLISLDGFRADYLVKYNRTPNIDRLISHGVHAPYMRSVYPTVTFPNHYTIVTVSTCLPHQHLPQPLHHRHGQYLSTTPTPSTTATPSSRSVAYRADESALFLL